MIKVRNKEGKRKRGENCVAAYQMFVSLIMTGLRQYHLITEDWHKVVTSRLHPFMTSHYHKDNQLKHRMESSVAVPLIVILMTIKEMYAIQMKKLHSMPLLSLVVVLTINYHHTQWKLHSTSPVQSCHSKVQVFNSLILKQHP